MRAFEPSKGCSEGLVWYPPSSNTSMKRGDPVHSGAIGTPSPPKRLSLHLRPTHRHYLTVEGIGVLFLSARFYEVGRSDEKLTHKRRYHVPPGISYPRARIVYSGFARKCSIYIPKSTTSGENQEVKTPPRTHSRTLGSARKSEGLGHSNPWLNHIYKQSHRAVREISSRVEHVQFS